MYTVPSYVTYRTEEYSIYITSELYLSLIHISVCCADEIDLQCLPEHPMARVQPAHRNHMGFYDRIVLRHTQNGGRSGRWSDPDVF